MNTLVTVRGIATEVTLGPDGSPKSGGARVVEVAIRNAALGRVALTWNTHTIELEPDQLESALRVLRTAREEKPT